MKRIIRTSALKNGLFFHNRFFISAFWIVSVGVLIGAVAAGAFFSNEESVISAIFQANFEKRELQSVFSCFVSTFSSSLFILILLYMFGLCAIGVPFIYITIAFYSIGKGLVFASFYLNYGFFGVLNAILFLLVQNVVVLLLVIYAAKLSFDMSRNMHGLLIGENKYMDFKVYFKRYNNKYIIFIIALALISIFDAIISRFTNLIIK